MGSIDQGNRSEVRIALKACRNNQSEAAIILGIHRNTLARWLRRWDIEDKAEERKKVAERPPYILLIENYDMHQKVAGAK